MALTAIPPLLSLLGFTGLAALALTQFRESRVHRLFALICIFACFLFVDILAASVLTSARTALWISRIDHAFVVFTPALYLHFFHEYLGIEQRRHLILSAYGLSCALALLTPTTLYIASMHRFFFGFYAQAGPLYAVFALYAAAVSLYVVALLAAAVSAETEPWRKKSLGYVLAGFGCMGVLNGLNLLPNFGYPVYPPGNFSFIPLAVLYVGLFRHDALNLGPLVRKGVVYSVLTAVVTGGYALAVTFVGLVFRPIQAGGRWGYATLFFLSVVLVLGPLKSKTQNLVDRLFYRERIHARQTLRRVSRQICTESDLKPIAECLSQTVASAMNAACCDLYVAGEAFSPQRSGFSSLEETAAIAEDAALVGLATRGPVVRARLNAAIGPQRKAIAEMKGLHAELLFPLVFGGNLRGFVALGEKRSGTAYDAEDVDLLETLAGQVSIGIENAINYRRILDFNRTLERRVDARTRALRKALAEKDRAKDQMVRSESLAAIGQLVAGVAHELNNPLAAARSLVQSVLEDLQDPQTDPSVLAESVQDLHFVLDQLGRAAGIVSSLLGLARQTRDYTEPVNVNSLVHDALRVLHGELKHRDIRIQTHLCEGLPAVRGNFAHLGQVVVNIVKNAAQAIGAASGTIEIATGFDAENRRVTLVCRDSGCGIPEELRKDIFKPFFTTKTVGEGTGLGLYLCHEILQRHGGAIRVSPPGPGGAEFTVDLPVGA